jgi:hypothetical protein
MRTPERPEKLSIDMPLDKAKSVTHEHLLSIINTEAGRAPYGCSTSGAGGANS